MPTLAEVWSVAAQRYSTCLQTAFDEILIGGQTIEQKYGVSRETCARFKVGFVPVADPFCEEVLLKQFGLDMADVHAGHGYGLLELSGINFSAATNYFSGRIVFPYPRNSQIVYWSGRMTDHTPPDHWAGRDKKNAKNLHMRRPPGDDSPLPLYLELDPRKPTQLVEGQFQALKLRQEGFAAVGIGGSRPNDAQIADLKHCQELTWLPDVDVLAPTPDGFRDTEQGREFVAGETVADRLQSLLDAWRKLPQMTLSRYPQEFCERNPKGDANDWFLAHPDPTEFLTAVLSQKLDLETAEVEAIPRELPTDQMVQRVIELLKRLQWKSPIESERILDKLKSHLKLSAKQLATFRSDLKELRSKGVAPPEDAKDFSQAQHIRELRAGQDFMDNKLYFTVWKESIVKKWTNGKELLESSVLPYVINSDGEFFPATPTEMLQRGFKFRKNSEPAVETYNWSTAETAPYGLPRFLQSPQTTDPDTWELYKELNDYLARYAYYDDATFYDFIELYVFASYLLMTFGGLGILAFNGTKNSGKSRSMELLESLCFNAIKASSMSDSFIYRIVDTSCATVLWDEAEGVSSAITVNNVVNEKSLLLQDGYRITGGVGRCVGTENTPKKFRSYATYCIGNTKGLNPTLRSRAYFFPTVRAPRSFKLNYWTEHRTREDSQSLRDRLHCWALRHAADVRKTYDRLEVGDLAPLLDELKLYNRDREIHTPLFALSITLDRLTGNPVEWTPELPTWQRPDSTSITGRLIASVQKLTKLKHELLLSDDITPTFLAALRQTIQQELVPEITRNTITDPHIARHWYESTALRTQLNKFVGLKYFPKKTGPQSLTFFLRDKVQVIADKDIARIRDGKKQLTVIRIDPDKLQEACHTHEVDDDAYIEVDQSLVSNQQQPSPEELDLDPTA